MFQFRILGQYADLCSNPNPGLQVVMLKRCWLRFYFSKHCSKNGCDTVELPNENRKFLISIVRVSHFLGYSWGSNLLTLGRFGA